MGDSLFSRGSKVPIARIETTLLPGSAAPLTLSGTAYIDKVLTSNYVGVSSHSLAHLAFLPFRLLPASLRSQAHLDKYVSALVSIHSLLPL